MRKLLFFIFMVSVIVTASACSQDKKTTDDLVLIKGGTFKNKKSNYYKKSVTLPDFYIGKYEVTQKEWVKLMGKNPSQFKSNKFPVENVNWYDSIEYCNKLSIKENLKPYYSINKKKKDSNNKSDKDNLKWVVTINEGSNGYRLPTEAEWEYAASGGSKSKSYKYSGSNDLEDVAWFWKNSGQKKLSGSWMWKAVQGNKNRSKNVGSKDPNELGLYDMSGNVREWCWDWHGNIENNKSFRSGSFRGPDSGSYRVWKGGCWMSDDKSCLISHRGTYESHSKGNDQGFRICRNK